MGKYMNDKPMGSSYDGGDRPVCGAAYCFFLRGFRAFFCVISSRGLTGIASIRRASSASDIAGSSFSISLLGLLLMGVR